MSRRRLMLLMILLLAVVGMGAHALLPSTGVSRSRGDGPPRRGRLVHSDMIFYVRVTGKLVDPVTDSGCAGAGGFVLPDRSCADDDELVEMYREWNAELDESDFRAAAHGPPWHVTGRVLLLPAYETTADGTFDVVVEVPWSVNTVDDVPLGPLHPPPRQGVEALLVEIEGRDAMVVDIAEDRGDWTEHPGHPDPKRRDLWATWDLGRVEVPTAD